jgi:hypothetical protein
MRCKAAITVSDAVPDTMATIVPLRHLVTLIGYNGMKLAIRNRSLVYAYIFSNKPCV